MSSQPETDPAKHWQVSQSKSDTGSDMTVNRCEFSAAATSTSIENFKSQEEMFKGSLEWICCQLEEIKQMQEAEKYAHDASKLQHSETGKRLEKLERKVH